MTRPVADPVGTFAPGLFAGEVALVTGGGRGIGRATALGFARLGADVVVAGRTAETLEATAAEVAALGRRAVALVADIRDVEQVEAMVERAAELGGIDHLVNNAGGQFPAPPSRISDRGWRAVVDLNLNGTWNVCSRTVPVMLEQGRGGSIVNVVHTQVLGRGAPLFVHSGAARSGVVNLTESMAMLLAGQGITVNAIAPGSVDTQGWREEELANIAPEDVAAYEAEIMADTPAARAATPDEIAAQILFLCSPAARYVTGTLLVADGGHSKGPQQAVYQPAKASW